MVRLHWLLDMQPMAPPGYSLLPIKDRNKDKTTSLVFGVPLAGPNYFSADFVWKLPKGLLCVVRISYIFLEYLIMHCAILASEKVLIYLFVLEKWCKSQHWKCYNFIPAPKIKMQSWLTFCVSLHVAFIPVDFAHFGNFAINNWPFATMPCHCGTFSWYPLLCFPR